MSFPKLDVINMNSKHVYLFLMLLVVLVVAVKEIIRWNPNIYGQCVTVLVGSKNYILHCKLNTCREYHYEKASV